MTTIFNTAGKILCILCSVILAVLVWKTAEYFNGLPERDKSKSLIAWDVIALFLMLVVTVIQLISM